LPSTMAALQTFAPSSDLPVGLNVRADVGVLLFASSGESVGDWRAQR